MIPRNDAPGKRVLLVDDEESTLSLASLTLRKAGISDVVCVSDSRAVPHYLAEHQVALVLLDLHMPRLSGMELLEIIRRDFPCTQVAIVTASHDLDQAIACMKSGAVDYLVKPVEFNRLVACVRNALSMVELQGEVAALKRSLLDRTLENPGAFSAILTRDHNMYAIFQYVEAVAPSLQPILILGETGTGKELMAESVHKASGVPGEFVTVNVAGLDDTMFSDCLFGHKKGAFTGADTARDGLVSKAARGTLFLDEIGDLGEASQIKLLRLLQQNEYYPVGSDTQKRSSARIVLATNVDLEERIAEGRFRRDLYYRLRTHQIFIPPLRERPHDIALLTRHFAGVAFELYRKKIPIRISSETLALLQRYPFPGNIRELQALLFDAVARQTTGSVRPKDLGLPKLSVAEGEAAPATSAFAHLFGRFPTLQEVEELLLDEALQIANGNHSRASLLLGVTRKTVTNRLNARVANGVCSSCRPLPVGDQP